MGEKEYREQNTELFKSILDTTFLRSWKKKGQLEMQEENTNGLELIITPHCNEACEYCYINKYRDDLYPKNIRKRDEILHNCEMVIDWLIENDYTPKLDLFSGELLAQEIGYEVLDIIYNKYKHLPKEKQLRAICIPTNYSFLLDDSIIEKVEMNIQRFECLGVPFYLSASVDGRCIEEENRPLIYKTDLLRDAPYYKTDEFYDKMFKFNKKWGFGFHPMLYSTTIDKWKDNFVWFQENMKKYGIPTSRLYLLEVRNQEWTEEQMKGLYEFLRFLIKWTYENIYESKKNEFLRFVRSERGFNILANVFSSTGRGLGCSLQSHMYVRLGDLGIVPCHRTMYKGYGYGKFVIEDNKIKDVVADNVEMMLGVLSLDYKSQPICETCVMKPFCSGGCLGSQYEVSGDFFSPIPTVCKMEHYKTMGIIDGFRDIGVYPDIYKMFDESRRNALTLMEKGMGRI